MRDMMDAKHAKHAKHAVHVIACKERGDSSNSSLHPLTEHAVQLDTV